MTLPEHVLSLEDRGARCERLRAAILQRRLHTFPAERGETVTLPNRRCQGENSRADTDLRRKTRLASSLQTSAHSGAAASCPTTPSCGAATTHPTPRRSSTGRA